MFRGKLWKKRKRLPHKMAIATHGLSSQIQSGPCLHVHRRAGRGNDCAVVPFAAFLHTTATTSSRPAAGRGRLEVPVGIVFPHRRAVGLQLDELVADLRARGDLRRALPVGRAVRAGAPGQHECFGDVPVI